MPASKPPRHTPRRRPPHPGPDVGLFATVAGEDGADRIMLDEGCAHLGVSVRTFRRQYLIPKRRAAAVAHFGIARDERGRVTVSRRLVLEHRRGVARESWGGAHGPSGAWGRRVRREEENLAAYVARVQPPSTGEITSQADPSQGELQGDLFAF